MDCMRSGLCWIIACSAMLGSGALDMHLTPVFLSVFVVCTWWRAASEQSPCHVFHRPLDGLRAV